MKNDDKKLPLATEIIIKLKKELLLYKILTVILEIIILIFIKILIGG